jgi:hypothetical protein
MHCIVPLGRRAYFPVPMPKAIPNMWPHLTTVPRANPLVVAISACTPNHLPAPLDRSSAHA